MTREEILPIVTTIARLGAGDEAVQQLRRNGLSEWDAELALVCVSVALGRALLERARGGSAAGFSDVIEIRLTPQVPGRQLYFSRLPVYVAALAVARECFEREIVPKDQAADLMYGSAEVRVANQLLQDGTSSPPTSYSPRRWPCALRASPHP